MAATLPLTGDGDINQNDGTPADGKYKLTDSTGTAAGKTLTIEGSDGSGTNQDGGDIILHPGTSTGSGDDGIVRIGDFITTPQLLLGGPNSNVASSELLFADSGGGTAPYHNGMGIRYNSGNNRLTIDDNFNAINTPLLTVIRNSGNVGIGTVNPTVMLDLESSSASDGIDINNTAVDGDPELRFQLSGTSIFTLGVDDGDADKFKIGTTAVGANTRLTIDSTGKVGIGTSSPVAKLDVESNSASDGICINNTAADGDPELRFQLSGTSIFTLGIDDGDSDKFKIGTTAVGTDTRFTIDSTGKVGIGTNSPTAKLDIESSAETDGICINNTFGNGKPEIRMQLAGTSKFVLGVDGDDGEKFKIGTTGIDTSTRLTIDSNGNVGIGTTGPNALFEVSESVVGPGYPPPPTGILDGIGGQINIANPNNSVFAGAALMFRSQGNSVEYNSAMVRTWHTDGNPGNEKDELSIANMQNGTMTEAIRINSKGNVGIGTTTPLGTLDINKSIIVVEAPSQTAADNLANIQNAINTASANGGGTVILQTGTYSVPKASGKTYAIELKDKVDLCGISSKGTIIVPTEDETTLIILDTTANTQVVNVIRNLRVFSNGKTDCIGIFLGTKNADANDTAQPCLIENVIVEGHPDEGKHMIIGIHVSSWLSAGTQSVPPNGHFLGLKVYHLE